MPEVLILGNDDKFLFEIDRLLSDSGIRTKSTVELKTAVEWLKVRTFQGLFVNSAVSVESQQELAGALWQKTPLAPFLVYDLEPKSTLGRSSRLFGAEVAAGKLADQVIRRCVETIKKNDEGKAFIGADKFGILVVEDLDSPRDIICAYIETLGYPRVEGFASAKVALQSLLENPGRYSCIVTDIRMPEMGGQDLIEYVRASDSLRHLPIIVLTAYGTVNCLVDCLRAGASGFLIKPPKKKDISWELLRAFRILNNKLDPRLASPDEAQEMQDLLIDKGLM